MPAVRMIFVGGFLGAGKTTLLAQAAGRLVRRGRRVGLITNDQARDLVDTAILQGGGFDIQEVAGGCFCCRINDLLDVSDKLLARIKPDVLIGEPVGSCTDISATVLNPLKKLHRGRFTVAPFSVLTDPARLRQSLWPGGRSPLPDSVVYIFRKQLEEADAVVLNKADLLQPRELEEMRALLAGQFPGRPVFEMSAGTGDGVDAWLDYVMSDAAGGQRIAPVDYKVYAEGEALLGWLNASVSLTGDAPPDWQRYCADLLSRMGEAFRARHAEVAHAKLLLTAPGCVIMANLTDSRSVPSVRGRNRGSSSQAELIVNARVNIAPAELRGVVEQCLAQAGDALEKKVRSRINRMENFSPAPPTPVYRYDDVVKE
jgi:Ni2+-binding GTPase involved in maturation of urease and hydrogenase